MSARQKDLVKQIEYPESDGQPMGETDKHIQLMLDLRFVLDEFFRTTERVSTALRRRHSNKRDPRSTRTLEHFHAHTSTSA